MTNSMTERMPDKIAAYVDWSCAHEWYALIGDELHEPGDVGYIRADIAEREIARLENIIADMATREVGKGDNND